MSTAPKPKLVAVDDSLGDRRLLRRALEDSAEVDVIVVERGEEALALTEAFSPSAVVVDLHLPGLDGLEVVRRLKAAPETREIPVVILSGDDRPAAASAALEAGATAFVRKADDVYVLAAEVLRACGLR